MEADVIDTFYTELSNFQHQQGAFNRDHIWMMTNTQDVYLLHEKYSLIETKGLGPFVCLVTSASTGSNCSERHWKQAKRHKKGKSGKLGTVKMKMLSTISTAHSYEPGLERTTAARTLHREMSPFLQSGFLGRGRRSGRRFNSTTRMMR